jgi:hypothetical protein
MGFAPFRDGDTYSAFQSHITKLTQEIRGLENATFSARHPRNSNSFT